MLNRVHARKQEETVTSFVAGFQVDPHDADAIAAAQADWGDGEPDAGVAG